MNPGPWFSGKAKTAAPRSRVIKYLPINATAFELIAEVYRILPTEDERNMWEALTRFHENEFTRAKNLARQRFGIEFIPSAYRLTGEV